MECHLIRSFLGMTQNVARFIPHYSTISEPLRQLTRKDTEWRWLERKELTLNKLKEALTGAGVMAYFDPNKDTNILVDASPVGLGAVLTPNWKILCYASRALTDVEQRYSQTEREMLAVVYAAEHFHFYLYGEKFTVNTDHRPLLGIVKSLKPATARVERWHLRLIPCRYSLIYQPWKNYLNSADYLSHHPHHKPEKDNAAEAYISYVVQNTIPKSITPEEAKKARKEDSLLQKVKAAVANGRWNNPQLSNFSPFKEKLSIINVLILRRHRLVTPSKLRKRMIDIAHHSDQSIDKIKQLIEEKVWFPRIDKPVEETVHSCIPCQASNPKHTRREPIHTTPLPAATWTEISVNFAGPFPSGEYLLVIIDDYSQFPEVEILPSLSANVVIPRLNIIFAKQRYPTIVKTDNGPPFQREDFKDFATQSGFKHRRIIPLWTAANGNTGPSLIPLQKYLLLKPAPAEKLTLAFSILLETTQKERR